MITQAFAQRFAAAWVTAWNRHDLDAVLAHCAQDIELTMPQLPTQIRRLRGKAAVGAFWARALTAPSLTVMPNLRLSAATPLAGSDSLVLRLHGSGRPNLQLFRFRPDGRVTAIAIHTRAPEPTHAVRRP
jgi:hypothetical protein